MAHRDESLQTSMEELGKWKGNTQDGLMDWEQTVRESKTGAHKSLFFSTEGCQRQRHPWCCSIDLISPQCSTFQIPGQHASALSETVVQTLLKAL